MRGAEILIKRKVRQYFENYFSKRDVKQLGNRDFVIVSKNCWGGQLYKWLDLPYSTPFVGLFLCGPCYIKLLKNFEHYLNQELQFIEKSKYEINVKEVYPIGMLDDVEIHFQHYENKEEAIEKWERRVKRLKNNMNFDNFFFTICDRRGATEKIIREFHQLPYKNKVSFGLNKIDGLDANQHVVIYDNPKSKRTEVQNGKKLFKLTFLYFDIGNWLNTGMVTRTRFKD
ncbi:uncharacterized protein (DUF1919 family) [Saonia flava]|uniref:Uncharacterized protein (DUF1919 family) n=1 Tax=Saonia flava TaxID=523696 RepID=A0A846QVU7_9FLAO|nr:DUF1919 domain-containing protein [Saonia flava]NJB72431.1 uncharacterized protein (DUF1919 family) [Saonia flava]